MSFSISQVDDSAIGQAVLVSIEVGADDEVTSHSFDVFSSPAGTIDNPQARAYAMLHSVEDDFPDRLFKVISNPRALYLAWYERVSSMMDEEDTTPEAYLEVVNG